MYDALINLAVGDTVETSALFGGVSEEPVTLVCTEVDKEDDVVDSVWLDFEMYYQGIYMQRKAAQLNGGKVIWL